MQNILNFMENYFMIPLKSNLFAEKRIFQKICKFAIVAKGFCVGLFILSAFVFAAYAYETIDTNILSIYKTNILFEKDVGNDKKVVCKIVKLETKKITGGRTPRVGYTTYFQVDLISPNKSTNTLWKHNEYTSSGFFSGVSCKESRKIYIYDILYSEKENEAIIVWGEFTKVYGEYIKCPPYPGTRVINDSLLIKGYAEDVISAKIVKNNGDYDVIVDYKNLTKEANLRGKEKKWDWNKEIIFRKKFRISGDKWVSIGEEEMIERKK